VAAMTFQEIDDFEKMVIYAERALETDAQNYQSMILLAGGFAQKTREHDLDKEEKLGKAEKYANQAIEVIKSAPRPRADITDEQWEGARKDMSSQAYDALGLAALARKKYDDAIKNFKASLDTAANQDPATKVRLAASYNFAGKYDEAISLLDALMADSGVHPTIMQFAQAEKAKAQEGKEGKK
jgi:tetratricopeptide (TPR) repeat protein